MSAYGKGTGQALRRRALNQIWTAAGEYGFEPLFLAMDTQGAPDLYMNCVVGLVRKWYGEEMPFGLFGWWSGDAREEMLDHLAWMAFESAVYRRELPVRPILADLRKQYAEQFFAQEYRLSRQEWLAKNQLVYSLQSTRWKTVLGQRLPMLTGRERRLYGALSPEEELDGEALDGLVRRTFLEFGLFNGKVRAKGALRFHLTGGWARAAVKLLPTELNRTERLSVNRSESAGGSGGGLRVDKKNVQFRDKADKDKDRSYIESCFGKSMFGPERLMQIEQELCKGVHLGCRLWFTEGKPSPDRRPRGEALRLADQAKLQYKRSLAAYEKDAELHRSAILRLTAQIKNCMLVHHQPASLAARVGSLDCRRVWRQVHLRDGRVFLRSEEESRPGFAVELLLDASASRLHCQETVAIQGYILSESLARCGIPVRVSSFCTLRGYTVLQVLKGYADKGGSKNIFRYFASGWNRDGLALRAVGALEDAPMNRRLLLVLTDANPSDSRRVPPDAKNPLGQRYEGTAGVRDAAAEVRALRGRGIRVAAVFYGRKECFSDARLIYGKELVHMERMDQLAMMAGQLIQNEIRELSV